MSGNGWWDTIGRLLGVGGTYESPRQNSLHNVFDGIVNPVDLHIMTQQYFDILSVYVRLGIGLLAWELIVRLYNMARRGSGGSELAEFLKSLLVTLVLIAFIPGLVLFLRDIFDAFASMSISTANVTPTTAGILARVDPLTGNYWVDAILAFIQTVLLVLLRLVMYIVMAMVWVSPILLYVTYALRWIPGVGEQLKKFGALFTAWAVGLIDSYLIVFAVGFAVTTIVFSNDPVANAWVNTAALLVCTALSWVAFQTLKTQGSVVVGELQSAFSVRRAPAGENSDSSDKPRESSRSRPSPSDDKPLKDRPENTLGSGDKEADKPGKNPADTSEHAPSTNEAVRQRPSSIAQRSKPQQPVTQSTTSPKHEVPMRSRREFLNLPHLPGKEESS